MHALSNSDVDLLGQPQWLRNLGLAEIFPIKPDARNGYPFFFPGDAPLFEVHLIWGVPLLLLGILFVLTSTRVRAVAGRRLLLAISLVPLLLGGTTVAYASYGVFQRNFGEMARLKSALRDSEEKVRTRSGGRRLDEAEFEQLQAELFEPRPTLRLQGISQLVEIKLMQSVPPYVGAHFGMGANAAFDLTSMVCTYSD